MSRLIGRLAIAGALTLAGIGLVVAQNNFPTPAGSGANGAVAMCPSTASAALKVPCDDTNPLSVKVTSGGGGAITIADGADVTQGTTTDAACATDNGTCTIGAVLKRIAQRLTSVITALGTPFQAGGSIGNTSFGATLPTTPLIASGNGIVVTPTTEAASGVVPSTAVAAAESCRVLQASAANVYRIIVGISTVSGYVMVFNATSAPVDGAVTPAIPAIRVVSDGTSGWLDTGNFEPPLRLGTGVTVCFSSTGPFSKTASATAAIGGLVK